MKALSEELENPMNVHRWRKLEGSDPTTFEMIQKIHTLQKRLISKTEEVCNRVIITNDRLFTLVASTKQVRLRLSWCWCNRIAFEKSTVLQTNDMDIHTPRTHSQPLRRRCAQKQTPSAHRCR